MKARVEVIIVAVRIRSVAIIEDEKNEIKQYLLGLASAADEERVELRLMTDPAFSEEFDIVVDEIATLYVSGELSGAEKTRVEQYFLRSPERWLKVQFICELLRQIGEDKNKQAESAPVEVADQKLLVDQKLVTDQKPSTPKLATDPLPLLRDPSPVVQHSTWGERLSAFWTGLPGALRPAISLGALLIVAGLVFWVISRNSNSNPTFASFEVSMSSAERDKGSPILKIPAQPGISEWRIKLKLPTPVAPQYRASLRGVGVSLPQLAVETQDAESMTVKVPANQLSRGGTYVIELTEINPEGEKPLRDAYVFAIE